MVEMVEMCLEAINYNIKNVSFYHFAFTSAVKPMRRFLFEMSLKDTLIILSLKVKINIYHQEKGQKRLLDFLLKIFQFLKDLGQQKNFGGVYLQVF